MSQSGNEDQRIAEIITAMGTASDGAWVYDVDAQTLWRCERWYRTLDVEPVQAAVPLGDALSRIHPDDRAHVEAALVQGERTQERLDYTYKVQAGDGGWLRVRERGGPLSLANRRLVVGSIVAVDESPSDQSLHESEKRFRLLAKNLPGAIFRYIRRPDGSDEIEYMSPGCALIWEVSAKQLQVDPSPLWDMVHPDDMPGMILSVKASAQMLEPWSYIWRITTPSGKQKWLHGRGQPDKRSDDAIVWHSLILDITDQKKAEGSVEAAMIAAEASNRAKTHFLASMSHELRTPLNSIIGFSDLMSGEFFGEHSSPKYKEYSHLVSKSANHLYKLLGDLLDLSRIEAGKITLHEEWTNVADSVDFCVQIMKEKLDAKKLRVSVDEAPGILLKADPTRFRQALLNPLTNAIRHTPNGGEIAIRLRLRDGLEIKVCDTGEGMTASEIAKIEAPLDFKGQSPYTSQHGAGLGLYITRNILHAHGGEVDITSVPEQGTCVSSIYPLDRVWTS